MTFVICLIKNIGSTVKSVRYPDIHVGLVGEDGNAFAILGRVVGALKTANVPGELITEFNREATAGDYNHLLETVMNWVETE